MDIVADISENVPNVAEVLTFPPNQDRRCSNKSTCLYEKKAENQRAEKKTALFVATAQASLVLVQPRVKLYPIKFPPVILFDDVIVDVWRRRLVVHLQRWAPDQRRAPKEADEMMSCIMNKFNFSRFRKFQEISANVGNKIC